MLNTIEGIYRDGTIRLLESPPSVREARVVVTFLPAPGPINLRDLGINETEAARLRASLETMADDWNRPEMDVYNDL